MSTLMSTLLQEVQCCHSTRVFLRFRKWIWAVLLSHTGTMYKAYTIFKKTSSTFLFSLQGSLFMTSNIWDVSCTLRSLRITGVQEFLGLAFAVGYLYLMSTLRRESDPLKCLQVYFLNNMSDKILQFNWELYICAIGWLNTLLMYAKALQVFVPVLEF